MQPVKLVDVCSGPKQLENIRGQVKAVTERNPDPKEARDEEPRHILQLRIVLVHHLVPLSQVLITSLGEAAEVDLHAREVQ